MEAKTRIILEILNVATDRLLAERAEDPTAPHGGCIVDLRDPALRERLALYMDDATTQVERSIADIRPVFSADIPSAYPTDQAPK